MSFEDLQSLPQPPTYLHIEVAQLKQQLAQQQGMLNQRFTQTVIDMMNGLSLFVNLASNGDEGAKQVLKQFRDILEQAAQGASPLIVINNATRA